MISIIVPVYNVDTFLKKCVDSILSQSYKNFELILVDDGSTDNSGNICDYYASIDKRVRVIHKINGGVGAARNTGMSIAKGKYITFIDSDDYVEPEYLSAFFRVPIKTEYFYVRAEAAIDKVDTVEKNENADYCLNNEKLG